MTRDRYVLSVAVIHTITARANALCLDWRLAQGLAASQRVVHTCTVKVDHHRLPKDVELDSAFVGVLSAYGRAGLDIDVAC
jgi:hypothetical protein